MYPELKDLKAIGWLRCSSKQQASTSIDDQETVIRAFAEQHGIIIVDFVRLEGKSASVRRTVEDQAATLIARKRKQNDFDAILIHDSSRFTRTGARHSMRMLDDLEVAGIELISAMGYMPRNDFSDLSDVQGAYVSREHAKRIAAGVARGQQSSIEQGRRAYCGAAPFGIDKLVQAADGKIVHRLHNRPNGEQWRLDPETREKLEVFPRNTPGMTSAHYRKTKEQKIVLIPGDPEEVAVVQTIYIASLDRRMGSASIAKLLNDAGMPSPRGGGWITSTVRSILKNPIYTGRGICNRRTTAIYYQRAASMPTQAKPTRETASGKTAQRLRPRDQWVVVEYPELANFLPAELRDAARRRHDEVMAADAAGRERSPAKDKHGVSEYLLKGLLTVQQGRYPMTGIAGRKGKHGTYRYYLVSRGRGIPSTGSLLARRLPAERLESFALGEIRKMLLLMPMLTQRVIEQTLAWQRGRLADGVDMSSVERELAQVKKKIKNLTVLAETDEIEEVRPRIKQLVAQKLVLEQQLKPVQGCDELTESEVAAVVRELLKELQEIGQVMGTLPRIQLRQLLEMFVESAVADLETGRVEFVLRVPSWAAADVGLGSNALYCDDVEANSKHFIRIPTWLDIPARKRSA